MGRRLGPWLLACAACADSGLTDPVTGLVPAEGPFPSVIVGELGWSDATSLGAATTVRERTRSVGFLSAPEAGQWCTATLIAPDAVLTASECLADAGAAGVTVSFRRETGIPEAEWREHRCERLLHIDEAFGFAVLGCDGRPGETFGVAGLRRGHLALDSAVYLVQQACDYYAESPCEPSKRVAEGDVVGVGAAFQYDADALEGALGGPVYSKREHEVVGIHRGGGPAGRANLGAAAVELLPLIEEALPELSLGRRGSSFGRPALPPDPFEPNHDELSATPVAVGFDSDQAWTDEGDVDVYELSLAEGDEVTIFLDFEHDAGDIDMALYFDALSGSKVASAVSATDGERISYRASESGRYFIQVYGYQGAVNGYRLRVR